MKNIELRKIGKVKSSHGIRGEVYALVFSHDVSWLDKDVVLHIGKSEQSAIQYKLKKFREHKDGFIAILDGVVDRNQSDLLAQQEIWVDASYFQSEEGESIYLVEIENFEVLDQVLGSIGRIVGFSTNTMQDLLVVKNTEGKEYEIPFVEEFVEEINYDTQKIMMNLPEGLLQINDKDQE